MPTARLTLETELPAANALGRAMTLLPALAPERPVFLYGAPLRDSALVLGAYQHAPHALRGEAFEAVALPVLRRSSGGAAVWGGAGVLYFALGLHDASALMACPPGKLLNRNVRGFLAGLRALGVQAAYFGRDFVSVAMQPAAYVGWAQYDDGRVLLEFFLGLDTTFVPAPGLSGYPERGEPALRGKVPLKLASALAEARPAADVLQALAEGYARAFALELETHELDADERKRAEALPAGFAVDLHAADRLTWSAPHEDAIGFVSAGVRLDAEGRVEALRVGGDFFQASDAAPALEARVLGKRLDETTIGAALDATYAATPGRIEGIRSLVTLQRAILDAGERARSG